MEYCKIVITSKEQASLIINASIRKFGGEMTYDEVLILLKETDAFLKVMSSDDIAWEKFHHDRSWFIKYLTALNIANDLNRTEHLVTLKVLIAGSNGNACEVEAVIPMPPSMNKNSSWYLNHVRDHVSSLYVQKGLTTLRPQEHIKEMIIIE